ncbi:protein of unknown function [uncultured Sphingopyxis sp.]|uniref:Uncharacterized protein n=1 Tax=uncultured Sphingopyxis sp. TaxID=310581 RepID=A0A1Y5Q206_9SPHN|nr:protein of unknown function [uncultured Sphingopyxis sp.]
MATITIGTPADKARLLHTLVLGFAADPVARWASPDAATYMSRRHEFFGAFGGAAFEHGTAFVADDGAALATWLPPGVQPDGEVMGAIMDEQTPAHRKAELDALVDQMDRFPPGRPGLVPAADRRRSRASGPRARHRADGGGDRGDRRRRPPRLSRKLEPAQHPALPPLRLRKHRRDPHPNFAGPDPDVAAGAGVGARPDPISHTVAPKPLSYNIRIWFILPDEAGKIPPSPRRAARRCRPGPLHPRAAARAPRRLDARAAGRLYRGARRNGLRRPGGGRGRALGDRRL